jgi:hypothetical protein
MTEYSDVKNAGIRLRAITHNRESEATLEEQRSWDGRIAAIEAEFEKSIIAAGMMDPEDAIQEIAVQHAERKIGVIFESGRTLEIQV